MQVEGTVDSWVEANVYQSLIAVKASLFVAAVIASCVGYQSLIEVNARLVRTLKTIIIIQYQSLIEVNASKNQKVLSSVIEKYQSLIEVNASVVEEKPTKPSTSVSIPYRG